MSADDTTREALVDYFGHDSWCDYSEKSPEGCTDTFGCGVWRRADGLLASDWLSAHVAAAVAAERERIAVAIEAELAACSPNEADGLWAALHIARTSTEGEG